MKLINRESAVVVFLMALMFGAGSFAAGSRASDPTLGCLTASESQALFVTWSALPDQAQKIVAGINDARARLRRGDLAGTKAALAALEGFSVGHLNALQAWKTQLDLAVLTDPVPPEPPVVDPPVEPEPEPPIVVPPVQPGGPIAGGDVFEQHAAYSWLPESYDLSAYGLGVVSIAQATDDMGPFTAILNSNESASEFALPTAEHAGKHWRGTSALCWPPPVKEEHGPKWWARTYNTSGALTNVLTWRVGDFHAGREGHVAYFNCLGDVALTDFIGIQHGGQLVQLVWRSWETKIPPDQWKQGDHTITLRRAVSIDGGCINEGSAVRASWPLSIANPGQRVVVEDCVVLCDLPQAFQDTSSQQLGPCRSHGALAFYPGDGMPGTIQRTPSAVVRNLRARCNLPDREMVRAWAVDDLLIEGGSIAAVGRPTRVVLIDSPKVRIVGVQMDAEIQIRDAAGQLVATDHYEPGESWAWGN